MDEAQLKESVLRSFIQSGDFDRIKEKLRSRLVEVGWTDQMQAFCKDYIEKNGSENIQLDDLVNAMLPQACTTIPDEVKGEMHKDIKQSIEKIRSESCRCGSNSPMSRLPSHIDLIINNSQSLSLSESTNKPATIKRSALEEGEKDKQQKSKSPRLAMNNSTHNGTVPKSLYDKDEIVRLILQYLTDNNLHQTAKILEEESHQTLHSQQYDKLATAFINGNWDKAEHVILKMKDSFDSLKTFDKFRFALLKQKYLELLEMKKYDAAVHVLRNELQPLEGCGTSEELHILSSYVICTSSDQLKSHANWIGSSLSDRKQLLDSLTPLLPKDLVITPHRLETLFTQAIFYQKSICKYHCKDANHDTLFLDHFCDHSIFPRSEIATLKGHKDEVWFVRFSNSGIKLASASKDATVVIWNVGDWEREFVLSGHSEPVAYLSWSPDDAYLLTASNDGSVKLWLSKSGLCQHTINRHSEAVTACTWFSDSQRFVTSSNDRTIAIWTVDGSLIFKWNDIRATEVAIDYTHSLLYASCLDKRIRIFDLDDHGETDVLHETDIITSFTLSTDGSLALVNIASAQIHLWDLRRGAIVQTYTGHKQGRFIIRSCFGGPDNSYVISGSEDGIIYAWKTESGELIEKIYGHEQTVNSVCWNPKQVMMACASDDKTVKVWGIK